MARFPWLQLGAAALVLAACDGGGSADSGTADMTTTDLGADAPAPADLGTDLPVGMDMPPCVDADGDGHGALSCGGDDCDDANSNRYPGNLEVCDAAGVDEDCDPATLGPDGDGDGAPYIGCCNTQADTTLLCGTDCDDTRATVNVTAVEACNGVDDNCNGMVDEGVATTSCMDADGDAHGSLALAVTQCGTPMGSTTVCNDCLDYDVSTYPGATEVCGDGTDNNCNGAIDEGCTCAPDGSTQSCGFDLGACRAGTQTCVGGVWEATCVGVTLPSLEVCNGVDDDCDGVIDDGVTFTFYPDCDGDGYGVDARAVVRCTRPTGVPPGCPRGVWTMNGGDCADTDPARHPGAGCGAADGGVDGAVDGGDLDAGPTGPVPVSVVAGHLFACAILSDTTVGCEGSNDVGQHGDGTVAPFGSYPSGPVGLRGVVELAVGGGGGTGTGHVCARRGDGTVVCWGAGMHGELGYGGFGDRTSPVGVPGILDAVQLVAGTQHTCALHADHTVSCWGSGSSGQLGNGGTADSAVPDVVFGLTDAIRLGSGEYHTCAVRTGGSVVCWGNDFRGQLGDGATTNQSRPVAVTLAAGVTATDVAGGGYHTCIATGAGAVQCWGANDSGQLGRGTTTMQELVPAGVTLSTGLATAVACGNAHTCALTSGGVECWGRGDAGQLGDSTSTMQTTPVVVVGLPSPSTISAAGTTSASFAGGQAYGWGAWNGDTSAAPAVGSFYSAP